MSEHTPGPWFAVRGHAYWEVEPHGAGDTAPFTVADVCPSEPGNPDGGLQEANARLIAAAPELLEALQNFVDSVTFIDPSGYPQSLEQARAAILKAKGGA